MPNNNSGSRLIKAAGGVAWRPGPDGEPEILLVHRTKYDDWSLPKGKAEPGEPLLVTAVREVLEEGGARLALGRRLASVRYNVGGRPKRVHYWAARTVSVDERAVPNSEVDRVAWVPASSAAQKVSYPHDHGVLADFAARPAGTVPLILLRHSKALPKSGWKRADADRPLDDSGRADAKTLADLLTCFAPRLRLISSTAARCTETLRPLAQLTGARVREVPSLYINAKSPRTGSADSGPDIDSLIREAIAAGEPTVVCAHRENLPDLRAAALAALTGHVAAGETSADDTGDAPFELPKEWDDALNTSGFWVLNVAPLPAPAEPEAVAEAPAAAPATQEPLARPLWRRLLGLPARDSARVEPAAVHSAVPEPGDEARAPEPADATETAEGSAPAGVLISADRYDLAELS
ncbi:NUDIX hydrolase [Trebonia kvetii]|uniref:NUDIX hydrolase n=1 Tax=Trebonia kvetii TaxID=2480626 RepID=A0A6P2BYW5_9ACTN|nr:NUDIX domain-containing protein [Trebonia kvetii]TVZ03406.1 NUDIX hydrolase [Trebonia kvetii]